ncbi:MAG: hypothetical protein J3K34DRAFT_411994 [Monoraphidium minutum]|nr:MAG: hypothetical protein J3K34DRAFT_411994 [Monoraphidium minutum]
MYSALIVPLVGGRTRGSLVQTTVASRDAAAPPRAAGTAAIQIWLGAHVRGADLSCQSSAHSPHVLVGCSARYRGSKDPLSVLDPADQPRASRQRCARWRLHSYTQIRVMVSSRTKPPHPMQRGAQNAPVSEIIKSMSTKAGCPEGDQRRRTRHAQFKAAGPTPWGGLSLLLAHNLEHARKGLH